MRYIRIFGACLIALGAASCGENKTADSQTQPELAAPRQAQVAAKSAPQSGVGQSAPPVDAQVTIACQILSGPGHVEQAKALKDQLIKGKKMKDWYVSHDDQQSTIYYGYYRSMDDPRLKQDRMKVMGLQDQVGNRPFRDAVPVSFNAPDPLAPPEFNLANAKGFWSLQIAAYQGAGRKEAAVEAVKAARAMGVEAYYHHGADVSIVCVGAWPEEAIKKQELDGSEGVDIADQQRPILVLGPGAEVSPEVTEQYSKNLVDKRTGRQVQVLKQSIEVVNPDMVATMRKYPTHSLNGYEDVETQKDPATGKPVMVPKHSVLVQIPHEESVLQSGPSFSQPTLLAPQPAAQPGAGQLKTLGQ
ncbi:MAG TPA: hypothetical protein VHS31_10875 [Tepidisphaeraceae bacterium]|jgi:hypothetical protein|nr:hypothetical protein [Tepidisphaeraceae bacterium]